MIGETTLTMLYVPLLFYLFNKFAERSKAKKEAVPSDETPSDGHALQVPLNEDTEDS